MLAHLLVDFWGNDMSGIEPLLLSALGGGMPGVGDMAQLMKMQGMGGGQTQQSPLKPRPVSQGQYQPARSLLEERQMMPSRRRIFLL